MSETRWHVVADAAALEFKAYTVVLAAADAAIAARGAFRIVLAGGTTPRGVYERLAEARASWANWHVYFGDERSVPTDNSMRNSRMVQDAWLQHVAIPSSQVHVVQHDNHVAQAARAYDESLRDVGPFDLVLLGLGDDGHTASLFPGHDWGASQAAPSVLAVTDAAKEPRERVTMSAKRLSDAREVWFLVSGRSKAHAICRWQQGDDIPARSIQPTNGVDVLLDAAASIEMSPIAVPPAAS